MMDENNRVVKALLGEYKRAVAEIIGVIEEISSEDLVEIVDKETTDEDCRSIQTILSHLVQSGYTYAIEIRKWLGESIPYRDKCHFNSAREYGDALYEMVDYNEALFSDYPTLPLFESNPSMKIYVRWGQSYDVEQLLEHAIVHILRHRRQIEGMKAKMGYL